MSSNGPYWAVKYRLLAIEFDLEVVGNSASPKSAESTGIIGNSTIAPAYFWFWIESWVLLLVPFALRGMKCEAGSVAINCVRSSGNVFRTLVSKRFIPKCITPSVELKLGQPKPILICSTEYP